MKVGMMVGMVCAVMIACGLWVNLRESEDRLAAAEDRLKEEVERGMVAAQEGVRYKCNMKIAGVLNVLGRLINEYGFDVNSWNRDPSPAILALLYENEEAVELTEKWWEDGDWGALSYPNRHLYMEAILAPIIDDLEDGHC